MNNIDKTMLTRFRNLNNEQMNKFLDMFLLLKQSSGPDALLKLDIFHLKESLSDAFVSIPAELKTMDFLVWCMSENFFLSAYLDDALLTSDLKKKLMILQPETIMNSKIFTLTPELYLEANKQAKRKATYNTLNFFTVLSIVWACVTVFAGFIFDFKEDEESKWVYYSLLSVFILMVCVGLIYRFFYLKKMKNELWKGVEK